MGALEGRPGKELLWRKLVLGSELSPTLQMLWLLVLTSPWLGGSVPVTPGESDPLQCAWGPWDSPRRNGDCPPFFFF